MRNNGLNFTKCLNGLKLRINYTNMALRFHIAGIFIDLITRNTETHPESSRNPSFLGCTCISLTKT